MYINKRGGKKFDVDYQRCSTILSTEIEHIRRNIDRNRELIKRRKNESKRDWKKEWKNTDLKLLMIK